MWGMTMSLRIMCTGCSSSSEGGFSAIGFKADETQSLTDGHAKFANALLVVDHEQTDAEFFLAERGLPSRALTGLSP